MAEKLTAAQWREIVAIRPPLVPEAVARAEMNRVRTEWGYFPLKSVIAECNELRSIVTLAKGLEAKLRKREHARAARLWRRLPHRAHRYAPMPPEHENERLTEDGA